MKKYILAAALVLASTSAMADRIIYVIAGNTNDLTITMQPGDKFHGVTISGKATGRIESGGQTKQGPDIVVNSVPLEISQFIADAIFSRTPFEIGIDKSNHNFAYVRAPVGFKEGAH